MNLRKDHYRGLSRGRARCRASGRAAADATQPPRAARRGGPAGGPGRGAGFPVPLPSLPPGTARRERGPRGGPRAGARQGRGGGARCRARAPRSPRPPSRGARRGPPGPRLARFRRRGRRRSAAGPPPRRGGGRLEPRRRGRRRGTAGRGFPRPSPSSPEPGSCASRVRAGGRGCRHGPSRRRSPLARRPTAGLRRRRLRRFSWTRRVRVARPAGTAASPPPPRFSPPLAPAAGRRPAPGTDPPFPPYPASPGGVLPPPGKGGGGVWDGGPRGAEGVPGQSAGGSAREGWGWRRGFVVRAPPAEPARAGRGSGERRRRGRQVRAAREGVFGVGGGGSPDPPRTGAGCCGAACPAGRPRRARPPGVPGFGARRRAARRRASPPPHLPLPPREGAEGGVPLRRRSRLWRARLRRVASRASGAARATALLPGAAPGY